MIYWVKGYSICKVSVWFWNEETLLNKYREFFQYRLGDLVYIILPLTSHLRTSCRKVSLKYVGPVVVYQIIYAKSSILCTLHGKLLLGLFEHDILKPAFIRTSQGNVTTM